MPLTLEDFSDASLASFGQPQDAVSSQQAEAAKATAYEQGYKAGWDDAIEAESESQSRIGAEFARHLQEMSFSFHEARTHVIQGMESLLQELLSTFLPALIRETMGQRILETLEPLVAECADSAVQIAVAPGCQSALEPHLSEAGIAMIQLIEEPSLSEGQAFLRLGENERKIDLTDAIETVSQSINSMYQLNERALKHG